MNKSCDNVHTSGAPSEQTAAGAYGSQSRASVILIEETDEDPPDEIEARNRRRIRFKEEVNDRIYISTRHK